MVEFNNSIISFDVILDIELPSACLSIPVTRIKEALKYFMIGELTDHHTKERKESLDYKILASSNTNESSNYKVN